MKLLSAWVLRGNGDVYNQTKYHGANSWHHHCVNRARVCRTWSSSSRTYHWCWLTSSSRSGRWILAGQEASRASLGSSTAQHLRQLSDIGRDPSRLILAEQLGRRAPPGLILEIDITQFLPGVVPHDK